MPRLKSHFLLLTFLCCFLTLSAQRSKIELARELVSEFVTTNHVPGLAIAVYHDGEIVWSEGFGYADLELSVPVDPQLTKFRIGSVSKPLTTSALGILMDKGKVELDVPVQQYVPSFPTKKYPITMRQLGGHQAGIRHYHAGEFLMSAHYSSVLAGLDIFKESPLLFEPGTQYKYSSYGFNLLSAAIETIAEQDFLDYMSKEVFERLGMHNTCADVNAEIIPHRTSFYMWSGRKYVNAPYVDNSYKWAGGGFLSTVEDLIKYGVAHMSGGYLSEKTLSVLQTPQRLASGDVTNYGLGWRTMEDDYGRQWKGHGGGSVGGTTMFMLSEEHNMVIAIAGNRSGIKYDGLHFKLANLFL